MCRSQALPPRTAAPGARFAHQEFTDDHLLPLVVVAVLGDVALRQLGS